MSEAALAYDITENLHGAEWRVTGSYDGDDNVCIYRDGELLRSLTVPGYTIWNYSAHLADIAASYHDMRAS